MSGSGPPGRVVPLDFLEQATAQPRFPIFPESETSFFLKVVDAQLTFEKDGSGGNRTRVRNGSYESSYRPAQTDYVRFPVDALGHRSLRFPAGA